jgi:hypothetical protein
VHYALAKNLARAELWRGAARLLDFGVPGDAKYTLGGWLTSAGDSRPFGDTRAMYMRGSLVKLALPADDDSPQRLTLRLRSFRRTPLTLYVNGKTILDSTLGGKDFEVVTLRLQQGVLHGGENKLELRAAAALSTAADGGFAIDFIELASAGTATEEAQAAEAPPAPAELTPAGAPNSLHLPLAVRLGYALEVPATAVLEGSVHAAKPGRLLVTAMRDGAQKTALATLDVGPDAKPFRIDLAALTGQIARIDLQALDGAVDISSPNISVATTTVHAGTRRPIKNVIVLLIDTLRADKLSPYNPKTRVRTPGLERFLRSASVMLDARSQENWTKPSVATLLSSLFPWQHNTYTDEAKLPADICRAEAGLAGPCGWAGGHVQYGLPSRGARPLRGGRTRWPATRRGSSGGRCSLHDRGFALRDARGRHAAALSRTRTEGRADARADPRFVRLGLHMGACCSGTGARLSRHRSRPSSPRAHRADQAQPLRHDRHGASRAWPRRASAN